MPNSNNNICPARFHGHARKGQFTSEYHSWRGMIQRCYNPNNTSFKNYGAKGITVDPSWRNFQTFYADMGPKPSPKHTLERKKGHLGYSKSNCIWATYSEQAHNSSRNHWITWNGETKILSDWAREIGCGSACLRVRLRLGWSIEKALSTPSARPVIDPVPDSIE